MSKSAFAATSARRVGQRVEIAGFIEGNAEDVGNRRRCRILCRSVEIHVGAVVQKRRIHRRSILARQVVDLHLPIDDNPVNAREDVVLEALPSWIPRRQSRIDENDGCSKMKDMAQPQERRRVADADDRAAFSIWYLFYARRPSGLGPPMLDIGTLLAAFAVPLSVIAVHLW